MSFTSFKDRPLRSREQIAREVHEVSADRGLDELATVIALMTISTEVGAADADGNRQWWCPSNPTNDPETDAFDHDSTSDDNRSSGYFQQQPGPNGEAWWGTARQRMTLAESAKMFLERLSDDYVNARDARTAGMFAQLVQGSAFPDRYAEKWDEAREVLARALTGVPEAKRKNVGWDGDPVWLEEVLRPVLGNRLKTLDGWDNRGHGDFGDIWGVMWHHTGSSRATAESIRDGRPDLEGPVSNLHIAPDGVVTIVAVGVSWHAGCGSYPGLPTNNANDRLIGIECAWPDVDARGKCDANQIWPDPQIISMRDVGAALTNRLGYGAERNIGHKEWAGSAQGKWDPGNIDMDWFRGEIAKAMRGEFREQPPVVATPTPVEGPILPPPANPRTDRALLEEIWAQLRGPQGNGWPQLGGKTLVDYVAGLGRYATDLSRQIADLRALQAATAPNKAEKKAPARKTPAEKAPAKKTPAKKTPAKEAPAKKTR
jgi:hypothetical protein